MRNIQPATTVARFLLKTLLATLVLSMTLNSAQAAVIGTQQAMQANNGAVAMERVQAFLTRDDAQAALVRMGVDPQMAMSRVATLTPAEVDALAQRIDQLPAGSIGVFELVGIVAVVLLILELVGVINIFSNF